MKKRILSGLLCAVMVLALLPAAALAAPLPSEAEAAQVLSALDIMTGDESGDMGLDRTITRAEFTKLVIAASPLRDNVGPETATDPYPDVPKSHWAAGYIQAAVNAGLVRGNLYGYFEPSRNITLAEGVTMVLRLLGYEDSDFSGKYPAGQMAKYRAMDLDQGVGTTASDGELTRRDALFLFYNLCTAKTKSGSYALDLLKPGKMLVKADGTIDTVALINSAMEGPLVASGNWTASVPFDAASAKVYRSGVESSFGAIAANDVVYFSKPMRTLWVYTNRATGTIQAITPTSAPTSVTVAGKSYAVETTAAAYALSDLGSFRVGDSATLLLGRDGKVAAVVSPSQSNSLVYGIISKVESGTYTDASGNPYSAASIFVTATDGITYNYRYEGKDPKVGAMVQVNSVGGKVEVQNLSAASLSGKVDAGGTKLGTHTFADDVEILDTYGKNGATIRVYPSRLAGLSITDSMVRWYLLDENGDISRLILKDATGDMHTYGVVTSSAENSFGTSVSGVYQYDAGGVPGVVNGSKIYNVKKGPFLLKMDDGKVDKFANLTEVKLTGVDGFTALSNNRKYAISENVMVYEVRDNKYYLSSLDLVTQGDFTLTGWYDRPESEGGQIRVILAK